MGEYNLKKIQKQLKELLPAKRYEHTIGVQYTAANMAMRYHINLETAQAAALLHDCAKYMPDEKILLKCKKYQLPITEVEERNPYLLHSKLGAYLAQKEYHISDEEILNSIRYHTTGRPAMSCLEKIIFTADYIEPGRPIVEGLSLVRSRVYINLEEAVYLILNDTLHYLESDSQKEIDRMTKKAYDYYKEKIATGETVLASSE